jgi:hypothetical protein
MLVAYLNLLLTRCLVALGNPLSWPLECFSINYGATKINIKMVIDLLNMLDDKILDCNRKVFENTTAGRRAVKNNPDRRLYAVLKPTRVENLRRVENVLYETDSAALNQIFHNAAKVLENLKVSK